MEKLYGITCAAITPMLPDGQVDEDSLRRFCRYLIDEGFNGIYPCGTNGEDVLLSGDERRRIAALCVEESRGNISCFIHCTAVTVEETLENVLHSKQIGAGGIGAMTPIFFGFNQATLEAFFDQVFEAAGEMPAYIYNLPLFTHNDVLPGTFARLLEKHPNLAGIKCTHPNDMRRVQDYLHIAPRPVDLLIGCDRLMLQAWLCGANGTISGPAAVFSRRFRRLWRQFCAGNMEGAMHTQNQIVAAYMKTEGIPAIPAVKAMLKMLGVIKYDNCRKPFLPLEKRGTAGA